MFQLFEYIKFLVTSTNQHGVHSPFVFDLVTKCFYDKSNYKAYTILKDYRESLLKNKANIEISDFGSGSRVFKSNNRSIRNIALTSGTTLKRTKLLYRITTYFNPKNSLELGTSLGLATHAMTIGSPNNSLRSIEGCGQISNFTRNLLKDEYPNVQISNSTFDEFLSKLSTEQYDLIYIDGNHNLNATLFHFNTLINHIHNDSVMIFDDIYWSKEMKMAWNKIQAHPKVTVTIDTFYWGFVFFRKEQVKENFKIRL